MNTTLLTTKLAAFTWVDTLIPTLPFIIAVSVDDRCQFQEQVSRKILSNPKESGIYLIYAIGAETPIYIGSGSNLHRRLTYHFSDSFSSNKNSTFKKNLLRDNLWEGKRSIKSCFCFRYFTVCFGRTEIENHLHTKYQVNTAKR